MTSTRNLNENIEYKLEKEKSVKHMEYIMSSSNQFSTNQKWNMFDLGGGVPKIDSSSMSYNSTDIESKLRGIRSSNLEGSDFNPTLHSKSITTTPLFHRSGVQLPPSILHVSNKSGFHNI